MLSTLGAKMEIPVKVLSPQDVAGGSSRSMSASGFLRLIAFLVLPAGFAASLDAQVAARFYLSKNTYSIGEPLMFTLEIKNSTPDSVYLFPKAAGKCSDAFTFSMTGNSFCSVSWDPACTDDTVELSAGETYTAEWPLDFWYHVTRKGTYEVSISRPIRYSTLKGGIQSLPVSSKMKLQLIPADPAQVEQSLQKFHADLQSPDNIVRHTALDVLSTTAPDYFYAEALRLARDPDPFNVEHAVGGLGRMNTPEARQVLAEVITTRTIEGSDDEQSARCHAIESLGNSGDSTYISFLEPYVPRASTCEGLYAMTAIAKLGKGSVVPLLQAQLQNPVQKQRWWAIRALRITNSPDAVDAIIIALRDKDPDIRAHAATSLTELTGHSVTKAGAAQPSLTQLENLWRAWWHIHRSSTTIGEYPGELCRMP